MTILYPLRNKTIWVAGHNGMVGRAVMRALSQRPDCEVIKAPPRSVLDLRCQQDTEDWLADNRPDVIILAAATVGGIGANSARPGQFLYDNLMIAANVIEAARRHGTEKLLYLGSSCIYPRQAAQPIEEQALLSGALEPTNEGYALAKIAGIKLCQTYRAQYGCDFISAMPCNLYGPDDHYDAQNSHVIPALIMKLAQAAQRQDSHVTLWGTGTPLREFLYVDDLAAALQCLLERYSAASPVNIGSGTEISIKALAGMIAQVTNYQGRISFDPSYPDGTPRKVLDSRMMHDLGWRAQTDLRAGLEAAWQDYQMRAGRS